MKNWLEKHLFMTRKELRGLSFLTILSILVWFAPAIYRTFFFQSPASDLQGKEREIRAFLATELSSDTRKTGPEAAAFRGIPFDPNHLTDRQGAQLGMSARQIRMIQNYVKKGGRFRKKEDLAKIYSISASDYQRLAPYIRLADTATLPAKRPAEETRSRAIPPGQTLLIELNATDSIELQELRGIGPVFASRIVRFRDLLGGFHHKQQLLEVYGMDAERYQQIEKHVYADSSMVVKIDINHADYATLSKHPWISARQARLIINYRQQHGPYRKAEDLLGIDLINEEFLRKIVPYLIFSEDSHD
jgi:competence protein ComEA